MSKYRRLRDHLDHAIGLQCPMTFKEVEATLGFPLPQSARRHAAWWANTGGGHVHAQAWLKAGWKTSRVDLAKETVMFIRDVAVDEAVAANGVRDREHVFHMSAFSPAVARLLHETAGVDGNLGDAAETLLRERVIERRRRLIEEFAARATGMTSDSVDLIREDRDER
jgi:hypothetical protein